MITLISGENSFENERALQATISSFDGTAEMVDGAELDIKMIPDLLMGATLFSNKRLVVIKNLSDNKLIWNDFDSWINSVSEDTHLVLVEPNPDKRTKTYKVLQKAAVIATSSLWTDRDITKVEHWVLEEAINSGIELDRKGARTLIDRVGIDQWALRDALDKLSVMGAVTPGLIESLIEANPTENVFLLFENALKGDSLKVKTMVNTLALTQDAYKLLGLLSSQATQLAILTLNDKPSSEVAKDIGVHPYALQKLSPTAKRIGKAGAKKVILALREADEAAKSSAIDPWLLIERALLKVAQL